MQYLTKTKKKHFLKDKLKHFNKTNSYHYEFRKGDFIENKIETYQIFIFTIREYVDEQKSKLNIFKFLGYKLNTKDKNICCNFKVVNYDKQCFYSDKYNLQNVTFLKDKENRYISDVFYHRYFNGELELMDIKETMLLEDVLIEYEIIDNGSEFEHCGRKAYYRDKYKHVNIELPFYLTYPLNKDMRFGLKDYDIEQSYTYRKITSKDIYSDKKLKFFKLNKWKIYA